MEEKRNEVSLLGKPIHCHQDGIKTIKFGEPLNEIHNNIQSYLNGQSLEELSWSQCQVFGLLIDGTFFQK